MKRKITAISLIVVCFAVMTSGTLAYFTAERKTHNVITSGGIDIAIIEKTEQEDGILVDFPEGGISGVMPGAFVSKIVSVENSGEKPAWVRVKTEQSILSADGEAMALMLEDEVPVMTLLVDDSSWMEHEGWYYYTEPIAPNSITEPLFEEVWFSAEMENEYQDCTAYIAVSAQAVQYDNNLIPEGGTVADVQGWPENSAEVRE